MRVHSIEWFKKNCWYGNIHGYYGYFYLDKSGYMPDEGIDICGKKVIKVGKRYKVPEGVKINDTIVKEFIYMPLWFFEKEGMEIE